MASKKIRKPIFNSYTEYIYYARHLSSEQRKVIFRSLSPDQKEFLDKSYLEEGWCDLFYRNEINAKIDELREKWKYDIIDIRYKAIKGKSVYVSCEFWKDVVKQFKTFKPESIEFIMKGMSSHPCEENKNVCLIKYSKE
jgi:hypothetical protein